MNKEELSEAMKHIRGKRKDYSTAGFKDPKIQAKIAETKRIQAEKRKHLRDTEEFNKLEES